VVGVDQIVGGVSEESMPLMRARPLGCRIRSGNELRRHWRCGSERRVIEGGEVLLRGANRILLDLLRFPVLARNRALLVGVGGDEAGVDRKSVGAHQPLCHAALNDALEHMTQQTALAKAAMPVLRERRVIGNLAVQTESAEPSVRQIEMNLLAEPPLGPDAHAVADAE
jgi:hypothetical protein